MTNTVSRRRFLGQAGGVSLFVALYRPTVATSAESNPLGTPIVDYHVHLDHSTIDLVLGLSRQRHIKFGIVEHAGTKANQYPTILSNDAELERYLAKLDGKPVFKGVQTEWTDWMGCFSQPVLAKLDYVLTDAMTYPGRDGQRVKLWERDAPQRVDMANPEAFMERYVAWYVDIMAKQPIDILANLTWLPRPLAARYDTLWTPSRMKRVIDAALKYGVALEISASLHLPKLPFLRLAKAAGAKFSFGSNGRYPDMGKLAYCLRMARELGLSGADLFSPAPDGQKAVQRRRPV